MQKNDRFGKEWSSNSANQEFPTDQQAQQGLSFLGATPPSYGLHDAMFQTLDWKDNWLFDQIQGVTDAYDQTLDLTVNGTRTALADAISFAIANQQVATETEAGIAPVATQDETNAGENDSKFVTPLKLKNWAKQATESVLGLLKVATQAQVDAGDDDTTAVTPKKLRWGVSYSLTGNGYVALPSWLGGVIIQWGRYSVQTNTLVSAVYPITYPNSYYVTLATLALDSFSTNTNEVVTSQQSNSGCKLRAGIDGQCQIITIGR